MAHLGLRELAHSLVPGVPLQTSGDVARLLTKLHDTIEMFCRCLVPLREGYVQFVSSMDLQRAASQRSLNRSKSALRVEQARDPSAVAAALLDWRNQDYDAPQVVEQIFADLMMHQVALVDGIMRGVQALLEELSPAHIERLVEENGPSGVSAMLGRHRALWQTFVAHHEELQNETRLFEVVFGQDFAESYREYLSRRGGTTR
jgi:type VI secretion system protein ImpI